MSKPHTEDTLDVALKEIVSITLKDVLGETPAEALMFHLGESGSLREAREFSRNLERLVGTGALVIEKLIVKALYERAGARPESGPFDFEESVGKAKSLLTKREAGP